MKCSPSGPANTKWTFVGVTRLTGFDQHDDGVTVHVAGPDGAYDLTAEYLVGADGGTSKTRHLAGIDFPGMSSYDLVMRMAFNVVPPDEWMAPVSGALGGVDGHPGYQALHGALPPLRFHRTDRGVFSCGAMGSRVVSMTYELDSTAREQRSDVARDEPPMSLAELEASASGCSARTCRCGPYRPTRQWIYAGSPASTQGSRRGTGSAG